MIDKNKQDKLANAKNPYCPLIKLNELAIDSDFDVRKAVIHNPNCPSTTLKRVYEYEDENNITSQNMLDIILSPNLPSKDVVPYYKRYRKKTGLINRGEVDYFSKIFDRLLSIVNDPTTTNDTLTDIANLNNNLYCKSYQNSSSDYSFLTKKLSNVIKKAKLELFIRKVKRIVITDNQEKTLEEKQEELKHQRLLEEQRKRDIEDTHSKLNENLKKIKELITFLLVNDIPTNLKIAIPEEELLIQVDDHKEINPYYLKYISFIDFAYINTTNLKVSHIDWRNTNISINPQTVYNKDLSYAKFNDSNITFKKFDGCILIGTDISQELDSTGIENAITDETTLLNSSIIKQSK